MCGIRSSLSITELISIWCAYWFGLFALVRRTSIGVASRPEARTLNPIIHSKPYINCFKPYYDGPTQCYNYPTVPYMEFVARAVPSFDVVRIHTTKSFNWLDLQVKSLFLSYGMIYSP